MPSRVAIVGAMSTCRACACGHAVEHATPGDEQGGFSIVETTGQPAGFAGSLAANDQPSMASATSWPSSGLEWNLSRLAGLDVLHLLDPFEHRLRPSDTRVRTRRAEEVDIGDAANDHREVGRCGRRPCPGTRTRG